MRHMGLDNKVRLKTVKSAIGLGSNGMERAQDSHYHGPAEDMVRSS